MPWKAIDPDRDLAGEARLQRGDNSEGSLKAAGVARASVLVAGTDNDTINLSVTTIARRLNPDIYVIIRQNQSADRLLIDAARANLRVVHSQKYLHFHPLPFFLTQFSAVIPPVAFAGKY